MHLWRRWINGCADSLVFLCFCIFVTESEPSVNTCWFHLFKMELHAM